MWFLEYKTMWTDEQRKAASERAKARWADPDYKISQKKSLLKPPQCPKCGESNIENFYVDKNGLRTNKNCRGCHKKDCKERWHKRSWLDRWASRNYKYGVTKEFLIGIYEKHQGKCAICNEVPTSERGLHIDHCHKTGAIRGLLCHGCNTGIGALKENPEIMLKAINYLK
jgi:hypothetical protein